MYLKKLSYSPDTFKAHINERELSVLYFLLKNAVCSTEDEKKLVDHMIYIIDFTLNRK